jgi:hypothetical protein
VAPDLGFSIRVGDFWGTDTVGGATLSVLSPYRFERVTPIVVAQLLAEGLTRRGDSWYSPAGLPYGFDLQAPELETEPDELRLVEEAAGKRMRCDILVHILVGNVAGRPALARVAEQVARWTEGWVHVEFARPPTAELLARLAAAGTCLPLPDAAFLDAAAMAAWRADPSFHVLK